MHSNILAARSPVFAALLKEKQLDDDQETNKENKGEEKEDGDEHKEEKEGEEDKVKEKITKERKSISPRKISLGPHRLEIKDLPPDTLEVLLKYIYTDSSNNVDLFSQTLLAASDRYQVNSVKINV